MVSALWESWQHGALHECVGKLGPPLTWLNSPTYTADGSSDPRSFEHAGRGAF